MSDLEARDGLRLLYVCLGDFHAGAGGRQMYAFARALVGAGHQVKLLVENDPATIAELGENVDVRVEVGAYRLGLRGPTRETMESARRFRPDALHLYEPRHVPSTAALAISRSLGVPLFVRFADDDRYIEDAAGGRGLAARLGKPVLKAAGNVVPRIWPFAHPQSFSQLAHRAAGFDAIAPALARVTAERLDRDCRSILPTVFAPPTAPTPRLPAALEVPEGARLLLFSGSVFRTQFADFELLLTAFARIAESRPDVHLLHTGRLAGRYTPELLRRLAGIGASRLHLLGYLPTEADVFDLMAACHVLIQPGEPSDFNRYRFPAKLHDYLLSGKPVVSYAVGVEEVIEEGRDALFTYTSDPPELAAAIVRLLDDGELAARIGAAGRASAARLFAPERAAADLEQYYREVLRVSGCRR